MKTDELLDMATRGMERTVSKQFALQLQSDPAGTLSPTLNSEADDVTPVGGAEPIKNTVAGLLTAACECDMSDLIIHAPLKALPGFLEATLLTWDDASSTWKLGPHTVVFDCYADEGPGALSAGAGEGWLYVTGPVEVAVGADVEVEGIWVEKNDKVQLTEKLGIVRFDTCCVKAAIAQVC